jgi:hypothetical protein
MSYMSYNGTASATGKTPFNFTNLIKERREKYSYPEELSD